MHYTVLTLTGHYKHRHQNQTGYSFTRCKGGRGLIHVELTYKTTTVKNRKHKNSKNLYFIAKETKINLKELNTENLAERKLDIPKPKAAKEMKKAKSVGVKKLKTN